MVTWEDSSGTYDDSVSGINARIYDAGGTARSGEFPVNSTTFGYQRNPYVAELADDGFVIAWDDWQGTGSTDRFGVVRGQAFDADGTPRGAEFLIDTLEGRAPTYPFSGSPTPHTNPAIAGLADGRFVLVWEHRVENDGESDTSGSSIQGQIFNADGTARGDDFQINTTAQFTQVDPSVSELSDGGFVVTWEDHSTTGADESSYAVRGQAFNADGTARGGEFLVNTTTESRQADPSVAALPDGQFVTAWEDYSRTGDDTDAFAIRAQIFDGVGTGTPTKTITGTVASENLDGGVDAEVIKGLDGDDFIRGGDGNDHVYGNKDDDQVYGNKGDDLVFGGQGADLVFGGQDDDQVYGNVGDDQVYGNLGADLLFGGQGSDDLFGGAGADQIYGNRDDDRIYGNKGDDTLFGGGGDDEFSFFDGDGHDTVGDFADGDTLAIKSGINATGIENFSDLEITNNDNGNAVVDLGDEASVTITGISAGELAASDFNFF